MEIEAYCNQHISTNSSAHFLVHREPSSSHVRRGKDLSGAAFINPIHEGSIISVCKMINNAFYMIEKEAHIGPLDKVENYPCEGARE